MENLEGFRLVRTNLHNIALDLKDYSRAFYDTGNHYMGDRLLEKCAEILEQEDLLDRLVDDEINIGLRRAQEATANMLDAALAGVQARFLAESGESE